MPVPAWPDYLIAAWAEFPLRSPAGSVGGVHQRIQLARRSAAHSKKERWGRQASVVLSVLARLMVNGTLKRHAAIRLTMAAHLCSTGYPYGVPFSATYRPDATPTHRWGPDRCDTLPPARPRRPPLEHAFAIQGAAPKIKGPSLKPV